MFDSYINKDFFEKNKARLINAITERIVNDDFSVIVHDYIFSKDFLVKLAKNYNGQTVYFCNIKLSKEDINFLRENHIEAFEKTEHENRKVSTKYAYDYITFEKLKETNELNIYTDISSEQINNLKYCNDGTLISISNIYFDEKDYFEDTIDLLNKLEKFDKNLSVRIYCDKKSNLPSSILTRDFGKLNIVINYELNDYSIEEYKNEESILDDMIKDIKDSDLSTFEKFISIYNIVKKYKPYKEVEDDEDRKLSRYLKYILYNDYIVCVGFQKLFTALLDKVGIQSTSYIVDVDTSYDDGFTLEDKPIDNVGHSRLLVYIKDEKYNIDGFYISDPTWDNDIMHDKYSNMIMPMDYMQKTLSLFGLKAIDYIFDVHSEEEYNYKKNLLLDKKIKNKIVSEDDDMALYKNIRDSYLDVYTMILETIKKLDTDKYNEIKESELFKKTNKIVRMAIENKNDIELLKNETFMYEKFINEIGPYIVSKTNNYIDNEVLAKAIINSKIKLGLLLPQNAEQYLDYLLEDMKINDDYNRPYEFPDNYLSSNDDGINLVAKSK